MDINARSLPQTQTRGSRAVLDNRFAFLIWFSVTTIFSFVIFLRHTKNFLCVRALLKALLCRYPSAPRTDVPFADGLHVSHSPVTFCGFVHIPGFVPGIWDLFPSRPPRSSARARRWLLSCCVTPAPWKVQGAAWCSYYLLLHPLRMLDPRGS